MAETKVVTTRVRVITANLRKNMSKKIWEAGLRIVLSHVGPRALVGVQEAYTARNKRILKRVAAEKHLKVLGLGLDSSLVYDPMHYRLVDVEVHKVPKSSRLLISPTRISLIARFEVIETGELVGILIGHRMNGVYTADAPLRFFKWRKAAWKAHQQMDDALVQSHSRITGKGSRHHLPILCVGDMNAHKPKYDGNPFGSHTQVLYSHVSDYIAVTTDDLTPNHTVTMLHKDWFHDHSDHLGLIVDVEIGHRVRASALSA